MKICKNYEPNGKTKTITCCRFVALHLVCFILVLFLANVGESSSSHYQIRTAAVGGTTTRTTIFRRAYTNNKKCNNKFVDRRSVLAFASCAAPRFDTFTDQIVSSSWGISNAKIESVEEVMRSCGGAVQGIREIPHILLDASQQKEVEEGPYLNRANDGFVYFECGSYSNYKTKIDIESLQCSGDNDNNVDNYVLASLTLPSSTTFKSRVILSGKLMMDDNHEEKFGIESKTMSRLYRVPFSETLSLKDVEYDVEQVDDIPRDILWTKQQMCFMPSSNQPWMLQRVKWDRFIVGEEKNDDHDDAQESGLEDSNVSSANTIAWVVARDTADDLAFDDSCNPVPKNSIMISIGVACKASRAVRSLVRTYSSDGMLLNVVIQEGLLQ